MIRSYLKEKMGFEPTVFNYTLIFKTNALNHSATFPLVDNYNLQKDAKFRKED